MPQLSSLPRDPGAGLQIERYRDTHFPHVRGLASAATAAALIDQPSWTTRRTIRRRCANDRAA
jgi:hypothetical protein